MTSLNVQVSNEFKKETSKAIVSILVFILCYLVLLGLSIVLCFFCIAGGAALIVSFKHVLGAFIGIGIASLGVFVFIFLIKFIFNSKKVDRSHMHEITSKDAPGLFSMIDEIVEIVGTKPPKRVYVSAEVNAYVFYDSSFWSMIFPVRKNLTIGLGLTNTITKDELKAILSHEFGHFSQGTMKVGSYVYHVNKVIYDILFDNDSYNKMLENWVSISSYFSFFTSMAVKLIQGIQWILIKMYEYVNKSYSSLSREMEFHADEIAANITGYEPLKSSLLRMPMSSYCFDHTLAFYQEKNTENIKSKNIFLDHSTVFNYNAKINELPIKNGLPEISLDEIKRYNKSKLVIKDQWASHPSNEDRIARIEKITKVSSLSDNLSANTIFNQLNDLQEKLTTILFIDVEFKGEIKWYTNEDFNAAYNEYTAKYSFNTIYNGYYDNKNILNFKIENPISQVNDYQIEELFNDDALEKVYIFNALESDSNVLTQIANKEFNIKSYEYDGKKYTIEETQQLIDELNIELEKSKEDVKQNDIRIFNYFRNLEVQKHLEPKLEKLYEDFFEAEKYLEEQANNLLKLKFKLHFLNEVTPNHLIVKKFEDAKPLESIIKTAILKILEDDMMKDEISQEMRDSLKEYASKNYNYFFDEEYQFEFLDILYKAFNHFNVLLPKKYFLMKKQLLDYQISLYQS